jgi:hypothetical protein
MQSRLGARDNSLICFAALRLCVNIALRSSISSHLQRAGVSR